MKIKQLAKFLHDKAIEFEGEFPDSGVAWKPYDMIQARSRRRYMYVAKQVLIAIKKGG